MEKDRLINQIKIRKHDYQNLEFYFIVEFKKFIQLFRLRSFIIQKINHYNTTPSNQSQRSFDNFKMVINLANNFSNENKAKLYFFYLPYYDSKFKKSDKIKIKIKKIVEEAQIPFVDLENEIFKKQNDISKLYADGHDSHYTPMTNKIIAEKILKLTQ